MKQELIKPGNIRKRNIISKKNVPSKNKSIWKIAVKI